MSTEQANSTWSATALARDEATIRGAALSVRQRKLLALLSTPMTIDSLATMSGIPHGEVESTLQRFSKIGLAATSATAAAPASLRASTFSDTSSDSGNKTMPLIVGGVALTAVAAAIWWFTQSGKPAPTSAPIATSPAPATASGSTTAPAPPALSAPGDSSTTSVFVGNPTAAAEVAKQAAAKEAVTKEAQARDAAAKTAAARTPAAATPATTPPTPAAATAAPAPSPTPAVVAAPPPAAAPPVAAPVAAPPPPPVAAPAVAAAPPPAPAPAAAAAAPREGALLSRVEPQFPRNADADRGTVRARLTVNAQGAVTNVEIVQANPPRVFDRNVRAALAQWRYEGTGEVQTKVVEVSFAR